uniref:Uncharacterized protein n=1 Tax=Monopterus albus TaxID=43700 RepID=A0A3Q3JR74_MONAL
SLLCSCLLLLCWYWRRLMAEQKNYMFSVYSDAIRTTVFSMLYCTVQDCCPLALSGSVCMCVFVCGSWHIKSMLNCTFFFLSILVILGKKRLQC